MINLLYKIKINKLLKIILIKMKKNSKTYTNILSNKKFNKLTLTLKKNKLIIFNYYNFLILII